MGVHVSLWKNKPGNDWETVNFDDELHSQNITHNLTEMAEKAGIYKAIWRPYKLQGLDDDQEELCSLKAKHIVHILQLGYEKMVNDPEYYEKFNSPNGWGTYKNFVPWVKRYIDACREYPYAFIEVDR